MATIAERTRKDGSPSFVAQVTRRAAGIQEAKTFDKRKAESGRDVGQTTREGN